MKALLPPSGAFASPVDHMQCDFCRQPITDGVGICPYCGHIQKTPEERSKSQRAKLVAVILSGAVLIAWHYFKP
jgi:uncharacterized Zn finger protein (UPF0148 family)